MFLWLTLPPPHDESLHFELIGHENWLNGRDQRLILRSIVISGDGAANADSTFDEKTPRGKYLKHS